MLKDMTKGRPLTLILKFLFPMLLGNLFQQLYSLTDMIIVGQFIGVEALAALGATGSLMFLVLGFVLGLSSGFAIPVARFFGAQDQQGIRLSIVTMTYLSIGISIVVTLGVLMSLDWILLWMQTPPEIYDQAREYVEIIFKGIIITMFYNILANISRALGDSRTPLYFLVLASILNVFLDIIFIVYLGFGVIGVAYATILAQLLAAILCFLYMYRKFFILRFSKKDLRVDRGAILYLLHMGIPMALQTSITAIGTILIQSAINPLGSNTVVAVAVAVRVQMLVIQPLETLGIATATYCSQNLGAKKLSRIYKGMKTAIGISFVLSALSMLIMFLFGTTLASLFLDKNGQTILPEVKTFLNISNYFLVILGWLFLLRNALQGLGFAFSAMLAGLAELLTRLVVTLFLVQQYGFLAICFSGPLAWILATGLLIPLYGRAMATLKKDYRFSVRKLSKIN